MKATNFFSLLVLAVAATACNFARFDRVPGTAIEQIPEELQGTYYAKESKKFKRPDTVYLVLKDKSFIYQEGSNKKEYPVNGEFITTAYSKYFFLSSRDTDIKNSYFVYVVEKNKKGLELRPVVTGFRKNEDLLSNFMTFNEVMGSDSVAIRTYAMDEEKLVQYYEKHLRREDGLELIKIK